MKRTIKWVYRCVRCDLCGKKSVAMVDPAMARRMASDQGWARMTTTLGKVDLCPACKRARVQRTADSLEEMLVHA